MKTYSSVGVERYITAGFLSLILAGALLLWCCNFAADMALSPIDALFLSTSAVCVTGLAPLDIGTGLALPSQFVLLVLIQLGGIGIMGATTSLLLISGHRLAFRDRLFLAGGFGLEGPMGVVRLLRLVLTHTLLFEAAGAALMFFSFRGTGLSTAQAAYHSIFHSVSAFCNAGFSLYSTNLEGFASSFVVPGTIMALIVVGGIGFPVMLELGDIRRGRTRFLSVYARVVLTATAVLLVFGTAAIAFSEWNAAFRDMTPLEKFWNALFGSVTARTAGFDTVHYARWSQEGIMITMFLMLIGASPSSTGGGLKTTTFAVLIWSAWSELRQEQDVNVRGRRIPDTTVRRALALAFIYFFTLFFASAVLSFADDIPYSSLVFEAVSALGTVGLSRGITPDLSATSKMMLILLMFWGRVGILTFSYSLVPRERHVDVRYPDANIPIG